MPRIQLDPFASVSLIHSVGALRSSETDCRLVHVSVAKIRLFAAIELMN